MQTSILLLASLFAVSSVGAYEWFITTRGFVYCPDRADKPKGVVQLWEYDGPEEEDEQARTTVRRLSEFRIDDSPSNAGKFQAYGIVGDEGMLGGIFNAPEPYLVVIARCGNRLIKQRKALPCNNNFIWGLEVVLDGRNDELQNC